MRTRICTIFLLASLSVKSGEISPYVGIKATGNSIEFHEGYGSPVFDKISTAPSFFVGIKLNDQLSGEVGYGSSKKHNSQKCIYGGSNMPGCQAPIPGGMFEVLETRLKYSYTDLGVKVFSLPSNNTRVFSHLGVSLVKIYAFHRLVSDENKEPIEPDIIEMSKRTYKKSKIVPHVMLGAEHFISKSISGSLFVDWRQSSKIRAKTVEQPSRSTEIRLRDSFGVGASISCYF